MPFGYYTLRNCHFLRTELSPLHISPYVKRRIAAPQHETYSHSQAEPFRNPATIPAEFRRPTL